MLGHGMIFKIEKDFPRVSRNASTTRLRMLFLEFSQRSWLNFKFFFEILGSTLNGLLHATSYIQRRVRAADVHIDMAEL